VGLDVLVRTVVRPTMIGALVVATGVGVEVLVEVGRMTGRVVGNVRGIAKPPLVDDELVVSGVDVGFGAGVVTVVLDGEEVAGTGTTVTIEVLTTGVCVDDGVLVEAISREVTGFKRVSRRLPLLLGELVGTAGGGEVVEV